MQRPIQLYNNPPQTLFTTNPHVFPIVHNRSFFGKKKSTETPDKQEAEAKNEEPESKKEAEPEAKKAADTEGAEATKEKPVQGQIDSSSGSSSSSEELELSKEDILHIK